ncbi:MAG: trehalose-phosphatase [bacterium]|nr:trehalose-phosphatase [Candidatus Margulisiibacteriota bacterium]
MKYLLFLDFDGTLTPIVKRPSLAKLSANHKNILKKLSQQPDITLAIISGRQLTDLKNKVGLTNIYYAGNHGLEIFGPKIRLTHPRASAAKPLLSKIKKELKQKLDKIPGVLVEDKILTLSIHYRLVKPSSLKKFKRALRETLAPDLKAKKIKLTEGKKVFEVRPNVPWDKGKTVLWFMKKLGRHKTPVYIGDDSTDEDAFRALSKKGITIRVGPSKGSVAQKFLKDVNQVFHFLKTMLR